VTRLFETGATRDSDETKLDYEGFIAPRVLRLYAEYMHECRLRNIPSGQTMRASDNWQHGIPQESYVKSGLRHMMEVWLKWRETGIVDRNAACGVMFNIMGLLFEDTRGPKTT